LGAKEGVNHNKRQRGYEARDKEDIINLITKFHEQGYSQVDIAKKLNISRGTIKRWNDELYFIWGSKKCKLYYTKARLF
jgi:DNA invertase Pin-like site-specific DNA recombinase